MNTDFHDLPVITRSTVALLILFSSFIGDHVLIKAIK